MEPVGTVLHAAAAAPVASGPRERAYGSSAPKPSRAGEAEGQSSGMYLSPRTAALWMVLRAVEQFRTVSQLGQGLEDASTTGFDIGREQTPGTDLAHSLDLYA